MSTETKPVTATPHEMLLAKGFKGMRPSRDINIAAIVADDYAAQQCAPLQERIKELELERDSALQALKTLIEKPIIL
jgi:hypothetical protein